MKIRIGCPAGVGDVAWMLAKLVHVRDEIEEIIVADGEPHRTTPFLDACGWKASYGHFDYRAILAFEDYHGLGPYRIDESMPRLPDGRPILKAQSPTWAEVRQVAAANGGVVLLECNQWLEAGWPLEQWLPDLPTDYYFLRHMDGWKSMNVDRGVGISAASYLGSKNWNTWDVAEWERLLNRILLRGWQPFILGAEFDDLSKELALRVECPNMVGRTTWSDVFGLHRLLDAYIGFSSGLGITRAMMDRPTMMFWPHHQRALSTSWADPKMIDSGRYVARMWQPVDEIASTVMDFLDRCERESKANGGEADGKRQEGREEADRQAGLR